MYACVCCVYVCVCACVPGVVPPRGGDGQRLFDGETTQQATPCILDRSVLIFMSTTSLA